MTYLSPKDISKLIPSGRRAGPCDRGAGVSMLLFFPAANCTKKWNQNININRHVAAGEIKRAVTSDKKLSKSLPIACSLDAIQCPAVLVQ